MGDDLVAVIRPKPSRVYWGTVGVVGAVLGFRVVQVASRLAYSMYDDAYIFFRYAANILDGCGVTFNCGEAAVEGFTSPLHLLLVTGLGGVLGGDMEDAGTVVGVLMMLGVIAVLLSTPRTDGLRQHRNSALAGAIAAAVVVTFSPLYIVNAVLGLEGLTASVAVLLFVRATLSDELRMARPLLVVAVLARPECALLGLGLVCFPRARRPQWWLPVLGSALAIVALRWLLFGDVVPNTYWAKAGGTARHAELGLAYIGGALTDFPMLALAPLGLAVPSLRRATGCFLVATVLWLAFFLRSGGDTFSYSRLVVPLVAPATLLAACGLSIVVLEWAKPRRWASTAAVATPLALAAAAGAVFSVNNDFETSHGFANVLRWRAVGEYLAVHHPGARVATTPIGAIGYYSKLPIIDLVGLTEPAIAKTETSVPIERLNRNWIAHERHNTPWVVAQKPDLIVMTKWRDHPWRTIAEARAGFYAEWLLLQEIKAGRIPYRLLSVEVARGVHWLMFERAQSQGDGSRLLGKRPSP